MVQTGSRAIRKQAAFDSMSSQHDNSSEGQPVKDGSPSVGGKASAAESGLCTFFTVVIPVFNEEHNLAELHRRLTTVLGELSQPYELLFIDDGSTDRSFEILEGLHKHDPCVRVLSFSRNFGHHLAVTAGMDAADGEVIVLMDADLQDLPEEIPALYEKLQEGYDVVYGIRTQKKHTLFKRATSAVFFALMRRMVEGFDINSGVFRIARRSVIDTVKQCRETDRLVVGLLSWAGFKQVGLPVQHGQRFAGETKYTLGKQVRLALTTIVAFTDVPLRAVMLLGLTVSLVSFLFAAVVIARKCIWGLGEIGWPSLMVVILFLGGLQLLCLGILGEYISRALTEARRRPIYVVARRLERRRK